MAIVGALISEPGILAHAPDGSLLDSASVIGMPGLVAGAVAPVNPASSADNVAWYPPYGRTLPIDFVPSDPLPALMVGTTGNQSARTRTATTATTAPNRPAARPAGKAPIVVWNVAPTVTWYGPGFYGGRTACGQRYTRQLVGVASRTLPCGTLVQFRWHGISVVAPVIDRGPFGSSGLVFDLSARLACDLFRERGQRNGCYTRYDMQWRVVGRRRN